MNNGVDQPWFAPPISTGTTHVLIVGAGLAGCNLAWSLLQKSISVTLIDASRRIAGEASANTRCVLRPHVTRSAGVHNQFNEAAFNHSKNTLQALANQGHPVISGFPGVLQLLKQQGEWPSLTSGRAVDVHRASEIAGLKLESPALHFAGAGWVDAASYCHALQALSASTSSFTLQLNARLSAIEPSTDGGSNTWNTQIESTDGSRFSSLSASSVVFCCGAGTTRIAQLSALPLQVSSGQTTLCRWPEGEPGLQAVLCGKRYLIPAGQDITLGATHWRDDRQTLPDPDDDELNIAATAKLLPDLPAGLAATAHWRSLRVSTPDRLPLVGALPDFGFYRRAYAALRHGAKHQLWPKAKYVDGLYVFAGLGSRGAVTASLCAELLAEQIAAAQTQQNTQTKTQLLHQSWSNLLHPARFFVRRLKREPAFAADGILNRKNPISPNR